MNGYEAYSLYQAVRLHFTSDKYNFFQYDGKTRISVESFQKRQDKFLFHRLARKYREDEIIPFLVSNFIKSENTWVKALFESEAEENYKQWKRKTDSMSRTYTEELEKIATPENFNQLFAVDDGQYPKLLVHFLQKDISIETMVILNSVFQFLPIWEKKIEEDIIFPKLSRKISKYGAFLSIDGEKYRKLTKKTLLLSENTI